MSSDIAIGTVALPNAGGMSKKPPHLIELTEGKVKSYLVTLDRPELLTGFIQVKGAFVASDKLPSLEEDVIGFVTQLPKESIFDLMLPTHRILSIKNLAFKAK